VLHSSGFETSSISENTPFRALWIWLRLSFL